jgi:hypothetical protein
MYRHPVGGELVVEIGDPSFPVRSTHISRDGRSVSTRGYGIMEIGDDRFFRFRVGLSGESDGGGSAVTRGGAARAVDDLALPSDYSLAVLDVSFRNATYPTSRILWGICRELRWSGNRARGRGIRGVENYPAAAHGAPFPSAAKPQSTYCSVRCSAVVGPSGVVSPRRAAQCASCLKNETAVSGITG